MLKQNEKRHHHAPQRMRSTYKKSDNALTNDLVLNVNKRIQRRSSHDLLAMREQEPSRKNTSIMFSRFTSTQLFRGFQIYE